MAEKEKCAIMTKNIPDNVIAGGNPCRVLRVITEDEMKKGI